MIQEWKKLKLRAEDDDDLEIFSECLFEAVIKVDNIKFVNKKKYFVILLDRFVWELAKGKSAELMQVTSLIYFENIYNIDIKIKNRSNLLFLNSLTYQDNNIFIFFNDNSLIRLESDRLSCLLEDVSNPVWPALAPNHKNFKKRN